MRFIYGRKGSDVHNGLLAFVAAHRGHAVKSQFGLGGECVDLVEVWLAAIGEPPISGNAADLLSNADPHTWLKTANGPLNSPAPGDVVVWRQGPGTSSLGIGPNGHTGICVGADPMWLLTFDQNWPEHSRADLVIHTYTGVAGWLTSRR